MPDTPNASEGCADAGRAAAVESRDVLGGTSKSSVLAQVAALEEWLAANKP